MALCVRYRGSSRSLNITRFGSRVSASCIAMNFTASSACMRTMYWPISAADRLGDLDQLAVGLAHVAMEELHHAEHLVAAAKRESESAVQPRTARESFALRKSHLSRMSAIHTGLPVAKARRMSPAPGRIAASTARCAAESADPGSPAYRCPTLARDAATRLQRAMPSGRRSAIRASCRSSR